MGAVNLCGFETTDTVECYQTAGTFTVQNSVARNGGYALRTNPTGINQGYVGIRGVTASGVSADAAVTLSYFRFYFRFAALPAADVLFFKVYASGSLDKLTLLLRTTGVLQTIDAGLATTNGSTTLSANTWYRINVTCGSHASTGTIQVSVDGTLDVNTTGNTRASNAAYVELGRNFGASANIDFYYDDFVWDDLNAPGAGRIVCLVPSADGTFTNGTAHGAATKWQCLTDVPCDNDTTYVNSVGNTNSYTAAMGSIPSVTSGARLKAIVVAKEDVLAIGSLKVRIYEAGGNSQTTTGADASPSYTVLYLAPSGPQAGGDWTDATLAGVEIGVIENSANASRFSAIYGMLDYDPPPPPLTQRRRSPRACAKSPDPWFTW